MFAVSFPTSAKYFLTGLTGVPVPATLSGTAAMMQKMNFPSRLRKIRGVLQKRKLDVFVLFTREGENRNVPYLSGFSGTAAALIITKREALIAVAPRSSGRAREEAKTFTVIDLKPRQRFSDVINYVLKRTPSRRKKRGG